MCQGRLLLLFLIVFPIVYNFSRFFELIVVKEISEEPANGFNDTVVARYQINATSLRTNPLYSVYYTTVSSKKECLSNIHLHYYTLL